MSCASRYFYINKMLHLEAIIQKAVLISVKAELDSTAPEVDAFPVA